MRYLNNAPAFRFISDPGHGWLEVKPSDLMCVGLSPRDFSRYSYRNHSDTAYFLEEDCDAPKFIAAYLARYGYEPKIKSDHVERTAIRRMPSIY